VLGYHNVNGLGAPGAGKAYLRDVALRLSDVHAISETSWNKGQVRALPHTDTERIAFLDDVADGIEQATAAHAQTPVGAPWASATYLWAGDLNLTANPSLDNEKRHSAPTPEVAAALDRLAQVMSGATDVYRALYPQGREYTHGSVEKKGSRRRLDVWFAPPAALLGPCGVVSARRVDREAAAF